MGQAKVVSSISHGGAQTDVTVEINGKTSVIRVNRGTKEAEAHALGLAQAEADQAPAPKVQDVERAATKGKEKS